MKRTDMVIAMLAAATVTTIEAAEPIVCLPKPVTCAPGSPDRFDPQLQRYLVEQQLQLQPHYWTTVYFYLPPLEDRELQELQIRYLEELLAREKAKLAE